VTLPKSLRGRRRYVFFEVETPPRRLVWRTRPAPHHLVRGAEPVRRRYERRDPRRTPRIRRLAGSGLGVVRCAHDRVEETRAALSCVDEVDGDRLGIRVLGVSGTLDAGRDRYGDAVPTTRATTVDGADAWERDGAVDVRTDDGFMCGTHHDYGKE